VSALALGLISVGSGYLLLSVGISIYRQRHAVPQGDPVSARITAAELSGCWKELSDVSEALRKHLERSHYLLDGYDPNQAQEWSNQGAVWLNQWKLLGKRCRFGAGAPAATPKEMEEMTSAYRELEDTFKVYRREILRFGGEQVPRLDRIRKRIERIGQRLDQAGTREGDEHL
jgi:hypothetical protein